MTTESVAPKTSGSTNGAPATQQAGVAATVDRLRKTFATGRTRDLEWRKRQLLQLQKLMEENEAEIAAALAEDLDRNPFEAYIADIATTAGEAKFAAKNLKRWTRRKYVLLEAPQLPGRGWIQYEPFGTVLIIGAWNYPFYLTLGPAVGAIAAGNAVVLKPSEIAPASSRLMAELVPRYLDGDAIAVVEGDGSVSQELIAQGFDRVMFTGGTEIGRKVYEGAAPHLTPVTLELGGKSPVIVAADADVDVAAKRIAWMKLLNAGQTCVAPDYVLADATIRDELVDKIGAAITKFRSKETAGMRIVNKRQFDRLKGYLSGKDGKVTVGGDCDESTLRIQPAVVVDPDLDGPLMCNEIFGPDPAGRHRPIPGRRNTIRQLPAQAAGRIPVHQVAGHARAGDQGGAGRRHAGQPPRLPGVDGQAAVRRGRHVRHGRLPRQVRVRGVQPPQVGADQAHPPRLLGVHLPALHRMGVQAGPKDVLIVDVSPPSNTSPSKHLRGT